MMLPKVSEQNRWAFGNVVFSDHLKHCGIADSRETFYHAGLSRGRAYRAMVSIIAGLRATAPRWIDRVAGRWASALSRQ